MQGNTPIDKRRFLAGLIAEARPGRMRFQTHAEVSRSILRALEDPEVTLATVTQLIRAEPLMAAHLVAVANSAAFTAGGRAIADLQGAVAKLGLGNVRSLAIAFLVRQMGDSPKTAHPRQRQMASQLWEHTAHVAALARVLARRVTRVNPDLALFAGIVHEVGGFYLLSRIAEHVALLEISWAEQDAEAELELMVELNRNVTHALDLPEPAMAGLEYMWSGFLAIPPRTLGDTLLLAEELAPVASPFSGAQTGSLEESGPSASIEMILDEETLSAILAESAAEVQSLAAALLFRQCDERR